MTDRNASGPGTPPTPISTEQAFLYAPLVYVDYKPQDPSKEYQGRGMTLISITAPSDGPVAIRQGDLIIPGTQVGFGGFTTMVGRKSLDTNPGKNDRDRDIYLLGVTHTGLQLARVDINDLSTFTEFKFWLPKDQKFTDTPPKPGLIDNAKLYMPGSFSSGSVFFSPYFGTFLMIYLNKKADSTFYIRYLDLTKPNSKSKTWKAGGIDGKGIEAEDAEALVHYTWSAEQKLYVSPPANGGYNYAGSPHPEFFNRQYFAKSLYPVGTADKDRFNEWYGGNFVSQDKANGQDGKFLLLSWTSQEKGGMNTGLYKIQLAVVEFDDIPDDRDNPKSKDEPSRTSPPGSSASESGTQANGPKAHGMETPPADSHDAIRFLIDKVQHGTASKQKSECVKYYLAGGIVMMVTVTMVLINLW